MVNEGKEVCIYISIPLVKLKLVHSSSFIGTKISRTKEKKTQHLKALLHCFLHLFSPFHRKKYSSFKQFVDFALQPQLKICSSTPSRSFQTFQVCMVDWSNKLHNFYTKLFTENWTGYLPAHLSVTCFIE